MLKHNQSRNRTRIGWTLLVGMMVLSLLVSGCGTQKPKVYRVGILSGLDTFASIADGFKAGMTELGYVEGKNITYDLQKLNNNPEGEQKAAKKFVDDKVDLIFAFPLGASKTAKAATQGTKVPVVFANSTTEGSGLVESVRQPGGNITGVRSPGSDLTVKRFEFLLEFAPQLKRLGAIYNPNYAANKPALEALRPVVSSKGIKLVEAPVASLTDMKAELQARAASGDIGMDAILILPDDLSQSTEGWPMISKFAAEHKVPIGGSALFELTTGALFTNNTDNAETGKLAATLADKILKGVSAGSLPVLTPEAHLQINYKLAQELGLTVPEGLLRQADKVIR